MAYGTVNADVIQTSTSGGILGAGNASIMKNRLINSAMVIDQRYAGTATANTINGYTLDRWQINQSTTGKLIVQQNAGSVTPPVGFTNYLGVTSQSSYSVGASDYYLIQQAIEGYNVADLGFGTANAKTVTVSFWVYSSLTGTFGGSLSSSGTARSYLFSYTISSANTWEYKTVTIAGDTSGTWGTTTGIGLNVRFSLGVGSTYSGTANTWSGSTYFSPTGATSVVGTNGATFYITGVQLEVGSNATGFEYRQYQQELALCQRYYQVAQRTEEFTLGVCINTTQARTTIDLLQEMRATPTVTLAPAGNSTGQMSFLTTIGNYPATIGTLSSGGASVNGFYITGTGFSASGWASGVGTWIYAASPNVKVWQASAEL